MAKTKKTPLDKLKDAFLKKKGLKLSALEVQSLIYGDNALLSLIEEWHI